MSELSWAAIVRAVHERARYLCEYCHTSQLITGQAMHIDHIDPDGGDGLDNLCLACANCNLSKAKATSAIDPETNEIVALYNPRSQIWDDHFAWYSNYIRLNGLTSVGRATITRLKMNQPRVVAARSLWVAVNLHPPKDESQ